MADASIARIETAAEKRDERRRVSALRNMQATLHSLTIEIDSICSMSDADRAVALARLNAKFVFLSMRAAGLRDESEELAEAAEYEQVTSDDLVAEQ